MIGGTWCKHYVDAIVKEVGAKTEPKNSTNRNAPHKRQKERIKC